MCCALQGGMNTCVRYEGIYIKSLVPGAAAEQDGRIQIGNQTSLINQYLTRVDIQIGNQTSLINQYQTSFTHSNR